MAGTRLINPDEEYRRYRRRLEFAGAFAGMLFVVLFGRFAWLQIVQHAHYQSLSESNRIALVPAIPPRGTIFDRRGEVLAQNYAAYTLEITPAKVGNVEATLEELARLVEITPGDRKRFRRLREETKDFERIPIRLRLTDEEVARFAVNRYRFPGVEVRGRMMRYYPHADSFAHVIGYIGRINQRDEDRLAASGQDANYRGTDHIGKLGVEARYEAWLHGRTGIERVENDSAGRAIRLISRTPPVAGHNIYLNLDTQLQQLAEKVFGDYRGALVALDPRNGGVLALVSKPGFDPNLFVDGIDQANWTELNNSPDRPLINRALRGIYPPGSTIKPFMALAGLELGYRKPHDSIADPGFYSLPGSRHQYRDWKKGGHGVVDMKKSVIVSCDTYYYQLANQMGIDNMQRFLTQFGFGRKTDVDLDGELAGLMPGPEWKKKRFKQPWWPGETVIAGIGQGYTLATPMQLALATMAIANNGVVYKPRLLRAWQDPQTGRMHHAAPEVMHRIKLNPEYLRQVKEAMVGVTQPGGTAAVAGQGAPYLFAGKTGTAQVVGIRQGARYVESQVAARHRDHALFIAFAPADDPKIVVAVMVENGGHGSSTAAPVARKVADYWLLGKLPEQFAPDDATNAADENEDAGPALEQAAPVAPATRNGAPHVD